MKSLALALLLPLTALADNEIGFIERFALAADREKALGELVPGSEEYYFFHALHYQNVRDSAKLNQILTQWRERVPDENEARRIILNREAILDYERDPQATLKYLIERLHIRHDHQRELRDQKPALPTQFDPARIGREIFLQDTLKHDGGFESLPQETLASLIRDQAPLSLHQRRNVLSKLQRPDVPNLVPAIIADLQADKSRTFGSLPIHRALLPEQLDALLQTFPQWLSQQAFVYTRLRKMAPSADVNLEYDDAERAAWLDRVWAFAQKLPPSQNTLKSRILYLRLDNDRKHGVYDRARFVEYLKLPRQQDYINYTYIKDVIPGELSDLNADLSEPLLISPPLTTDEALVREYFLHLFASEVKPDSDPNDVLAQWTTYIAEEWLTPVLAEALITHRIGSPEHWASLITPTEFQQLKDRVDIEFPATNAPQFSPGDDIQFDVTVKNTPKLIVKIFELNTLNFFQTQQRQLNTDLNLDGLVANSEQTHAFDGGPFARTRQTFKFPELKDKRGAWIIEFIGGGRSSRALIRTGQFHVLQQTGPSGDLILVLDEKNQPVNDAVAWFEGRKLVRSEKFGRIVIPFTHQPGTKNLVIGDAAGSFATLTSFTHHAEDYRLDAQFHIEREQLLARREATLAVRTDLMIGEAHLAPEHLTEPRLNITSTTLDGISTTREVKDLKLSAGSDLTHTLTVPERLATLTVTFIAKVAVVSDGGTKKDLTASHTWTLNGIDKTDAVSDGHLSTFEGQRVFELLGKNGEPIADQQVLFTFKHRDFSRTQVIPLRTDDKGRVNLGKLDGIESVVAKIPNGRQTLWPLLDAEDTLSTTIHARQGETIRVPIHDVGSVPVSLLAETSGTFTADLAAFLKSDNGLLTISGLTPGDYSLKIPDQPLITLKVAQGETLGGWVLGKHRQLELKGNTPLHILSIENDKDFITVKLANSSPFARVHFAASRFDPGSGIFGGLGSFTRFGAASGTPARNPNLFSAGREIGDEYRYILERRYARLFPGNMLTRPGLLLNPWEIRSTDLDELAQAGGQASSMTRGGAAGVAYDADKMAAKKMKAQSGPQGGTNLDFLAASAPVIYNLVPDKEGVVRIERKALGDRQHVQIYAEDLQNASWRTLTLPESSTKFADQRLAHHLDPKTPFTQKKEITVLETGKALTLADILTSELETYDTLGGIHSLFTTLSSDGHLAEFAWLLNWPKLKEDEKRAKYGEFACHELNFFLSRKDKPFFDAVVKPYLANKKDKTFMDEFLLGLDLAPYLEPWAYARLNIVERILLAQRIQNEAPNAARHVRELWEMIPPNPEQQDYLFETALRGRALEYSGGSPAALDSAPANPAMARQMSPPPPPAPAMAADPFAAPAAAAPAGSFAMGGEAGAALGNNSSSNRRRSMTAVELQQLPALKNGAAEMPKELAALGRDREDALRKSGAGGWAVTGANTYTGGTTIPAGQLLYFDAGSVKDSQQQVRAYFRVLGPTKEWAENNYYKLRIADQAADLVTVNAFWRDYAAWVAAGSKGGFVSSNVAEASNNFTEMVLALAVLDLPFEAPKHSTKADNGKFIFTAGGPCILYHKEIKPAAVENNAQGQLLVSQSFFRQSDRYRMEGNEKFEKYVTTEFLTGATYGANIVVTNPTSSPVKAVVLLQIPQGALPVLGSKATDSRQRRLEPYTTQTFEYHFYFPLIPTKAGLKFAHFPVNVATSTSTAGAKPFEFNVVPKLTEVDKASWDYVSQHSSEAEVFTFLDQANLESLDLARVAWRCRQSVNFYQKLIAYMRAHHLDNETIDTYALLHNDAATLREWLKVHFGDACGPYFSSKLLTLDPVERRSYEQLEYSPLINQRAHRVGSEWRIANPAALEQYTKLLGILAHKPQLDAMDNLNVAYFLFLQDRVEEALTRFKSIDASKLPTKVQHDYFQCYAAFYEGDLAAARGLAAKYADHPVPRWRLLFADVTAQINEIEGRDAKTEKGDKPDREKQQAELASTEPGFDFKVENKSIALSWKNLGEVTLNYYLMDPEFSFSSNPFVSQDAGRFSIIKPNQTATQVLPKNQTTLDLALPAEFTKANVLVEVIGAGLRKTQVYHANTLKVTLSENYGRLETRDTTSDKPLPKTYVKVYARLNNGTVRFFKDGYTDLRGRFDYASLNGPGNSSPQPTPYEAAPANGLDYQMLKPAELSNVEKIAILILSDTHGATVKEVNPPGR
ncbi:MAG: autotransporter-associated beta strand repeat-containing protein [Verrucomicrobia bacterium]|nr:autotransporter-associated beta strand repeat-containing protein [Verrucomicrobiota bacterium]